MEEQAPTLSYGGKIPREDRARRPTRLVLFGVLLICAGAICGFIMLMIPIASQMALQQQQSSYRTLRGATSPPVDLKALVAPMLRFGAMATMLIWTGIGSIMMRRWSRPIAISLAGIALYGGVITLAQIGVDWLMDPMYGSSALMNAPNVRAARMQQQTQPIASISYAIGYFLAGIFFPAMILLGFASRETRAMLEELDPTPAWTDRCPVPVFVLAAGLAYVSFLMLLLLPFGQAPFFGQVLRDMMAALELIVVAGLLFVASVLVYRMNATGPWLAILLIVALAASAVMTARESALADPFQQRDFRAFSSVQTLQLASTRGIVSTGVLILPAICYILYVRRVMSVRPIEHPNIP
jgi:hypothetical protein